MRLLLTGISGFVGQNMVNYFSAQHQICGIDQIFKDPMTTAAAIDRLVHHSVILELNLPSYRLEKSKENKAK